MLGDSGNRECGNDGLGELLTADKEGVESVRAVGAVLKENRDGSFDVKSATIGSRASAKEQLQI